MCFLREPDPPGYGDVPGKHKQGVRWRLARNVRLLRVMRGWSQEALAFCDFKIGVLFIYGSVLFW